MNKYINNTLKTPYYIIDESLVIKNLKLLKSIVDKTGCKILLAQKAFSLFSMYPLIGQYLNGTTASGLFEARLAYEYMKKENHIFSPAYLEDEFDEILNICDHIIFNSFNQWDKFKDKALKSNKKFGLRINPECSTQNNAIYDPCSKSSRLGIPVSQFKNKSLDGISGLHFHTLCEQNSDALVTTLKSVEENFSKYFDKIEWLNFGGGHHITRDDYDVELLISEINRIKSKYKLEVILEPGEAVVLNSGFLVSSVIDILDYDTKIAILDTSAACHMPDVMEVPYRPNIASSTSSGKYIYRLGGPTCLAGDIIGDYNFDSPLNIGERLVFLDMALYTMVKNNTFNGMNLPSIVLYTKDDETRLIRSFGYENFKNRLS